MGKAKKPLRDVSRLSGKPLSETLIPSSLFGAATDAGSDPNYNFKEQEAKAEAWVTSPDLIEYSLPYAPQDIQDTALFLLANPNITSSVLFRADILADSETDSRARHVGVATDPAVHLEQAGESSLREGKRALENVEQLPARTVPGFELKRTLVRRLIPRNAQLDRPLNQTCHVYEGVSSLSASPAVEASESKPRPSRSRFLVAYTPHVEREEDIPYYHPNLRATALLYEYEYGNEGSQSHSSTPDTKDLEAQATTPKERERPRGRGTMSIHFLPFPKTDTTNPIQPSLERKLLNLIEAQIRITRGRLGSASNKPTTESPYAAIKDNVISRARVQDTYSRLKIKYAADLTGRWVESTEPSKHVFEDLGVAAFLVELWRDIYGVVPMDESSYSSSSSFWLSETDASSGSSSTVTNANATEHRNQQFPGFVDIACGNGVLVYILLSEGYPGWGFDARRRKTWSIFPEHIQGRLREDLYIPGPFADALSAPSSSEQEQRQKQKQKQNNASPPESELHSKLQQNTFIISNHADELTLWTPLLATYLNPDNPPPFLAIPCCSHSLSGARYRYSPQKQSTFISEAKNAKDKPSHQASNLNTDPDPSKAGSLTQLRATKLTAQNPHSASFSTSTYGALTEKVVSLSTEAGFDVVKTLLRIPSTRNIGVLGNCSPRREEEPKGKNEGDVLSRVGAILERECARDGGVYAAAKIWVERAEKLMTGPKQHNYGLV
ncbi:tRNA (uracil) methyltransferase [Aspergillus undulatus]|uniref:tRNA (uracil) methyltransferase n=1 Tax=Aspergillus undulatus TaxID=1810928 RepID=UPI003CCDAE73